MKTRFLPLFTAAVLSAAAMLSCAQSGPRILTSSVKLIRVQEPSGEFSERLSVFALFEDEDGKEDFSSITVRHEDSGVFWFLEARDVEARIRGPDRWIGSSSLAPSPEPEFPDGDYTVSAADLAGNEAFHTFTLNRPDFPDTVPITFTLEGDLWTIEQNPEAGRFTEVFLFIYNRDMQLISAQKIPGGSLTHVGDLDLIRRDFPESSVVQAFVQTPDGTAGVLLSPVDME